MPHIDPEVRRKYQKQWANKLYHKRRSEFLKGKCCVKCGSTKRLELDHIDPTTRPNFWHGIWTMSPKIRERELKLVQVMCRPCHWQKTRDERGWRIKHGTTNAYKNYKCRCEPCRKAKADYKKKYEAKRK